MEGLSKITDMGRSKEFPKSMSYTEFVGLLKEYGVNNVSVCLESTIGGESNVFSIDHPFDLSVILSYWKLRYNKNERVYLTDLFDELNKEFSEFISHNLPSTYKIDKEEFDSLPSEEKKEIEKDQKTIFLQGYLFNLKKY